MFYTCALRRRFQCALAALALGVISACSPNNNGADSSEPEPTAQARNALSWSTEAILLPDPGFDPFSEYFGDALAIHGDWAFVHAQIAGEDRVRAYQWDGASWPLKQEIKETALTGDFGLTLAADGDVLAIGCPSEDLPGSAYGAVYMYQLSAGQWTFKQKLHDVSSSPAKGFADRLALSGDTLVVGEPSASSAEGPETGLILVYRRLGATWVQEQWLQAPSPFMDERFGQAISASGDRIVASERSGDVYMFHFSGNQWTLEDQPFDVNVAAFPNPFGGTLSLSGDRLLIGDRQDGHALGHVHDRSGGLWPFKETLTGAPTTSGAYAFPQVAVSGPLAAVSYSDFEGPAGESGAVHVFAETPAGFLEQAEITFPGSLKVGKVAHLSGSLLAVGAENEVFLLRLKAALGAVCQNGESCESGFCADGVCCDTACGVDGDCEVCSVALGAGSDGTCALATAGSVCRPVAGDCDVPESCDGTTAACPPDQVAPANKVCRGAVGQCDLAELCGGGAVCPPDNVAASGVICREAKNDCDAADACDGINSACPPDESLPDGTECATGSVCSTGLCGFGVCTAIPVSCDDANPCTEDSCGDAEGCLHTPIQGCGGSSSSGGSGGGSTDSPPTEGCDCRLSSGPAERPALPMGAGLTAVLIALFRARRRSKRRSSSVVPAPRNPGNVRDGRRSQRETVTVK